ncbi:MAG: radical SAM protein [Deltaproteobacteria bacterium]|nr:radical SAM protein [Deltaproteobacteria bacterium]
MSLNTDGRKWIYGPVPSRRFGLSLGVDLVPYKVCSYDCVYCQVGKTTDREVDLRDWVEPRVVADAVVDAVSGDVRPDVVTMAGSGEPTLYRSLGLLIHDIKDRTAGIPVVVLTNGSLFWMDEVVEAVEEADVLAPSLDAGDEKTFRGLNRPHPSITFDRMLDGLEKVTHAFAGTVRLEVMLVAGANDSNESLHRIAHCMERLRVDVVDVNTVVRPVPGARPMACSLAVLEKAAAIFGPKAHIVPEEADLHGRESELKSLTDAADRILALVSRRPATPAQIRVALGLQPVIQSKALAKLLHDGRVVERILDGDAFIAVNRK